MVIIKKIEIITPGSQVGSKLGNPCLIDHVILPNDYSSVSDVKELFEKREEKINLLNEIDEEKEEILIAYRKEIETLESKHKQQMKLIQERHEFDRKRNDERFRKAMNGKNVERKSLKADLHNIQGRIQELQNKTNKNTSELEIPKCPVCLEEMGPPKKIHNCVLGHSFCSLCVPQLDKCPKCRKGFGGRNFVLENLISKMNI